MTESEVPSTSLLSPRQTQIVILVASGYLDKQIARQLGIQVSTVRSHIERIAWKTGRSRRAEVTALAYQLELL